MRPATLRYLYFALAAGAFGLWMVYLYYLTTHLPNSPNGLPVLLSRPQFLVSDLDVIGAIEDTDRAVPLSELLGDDADACGLAVGLGLTQVPVTVRVVKVKTVLYPPSSPVKTGQIIGVTNFKDCQIPGKSGSHPTPPAALPDNLSELGPCLLPLRSLDGGATWEVVPLPRSPGFGVGNPRIYPVTDETLAQYRKIEK